MFNTNIPTFLDPNKRKKQPQLYTCGRCGRQTGTRHLTKCDNFDHCHQFICRNCRPFQMLPKYCNYCEPNFQFKTQQAEQILDKITYANNCLHIQRESEANNIIDSIIEDLK